MAMEKEKENILLIIWTQGNAAKILSIDFSTGGLTSTELSAYKVSNVFNG